MTWLTPGGVAAAVLVGGAVAWGLRWVALIPLFTFLVSGSLLARRAGVAAAPRTARQVVANGAVAAIAAVAHLWPAAAGAIAAAAADTWATEIGSRSRQPPRLITTGEPVPHGTSGGITVLGTAGGAVGALMIALFCAYAAPELRWRGCWVVAISGVTGMIADSVLGATLQARRWLDNDAVNLLGSLTGALTAAAGATLWT